MAANKLTYLPLLQFYLLYSWRFAVVPAVIFLSLCGYTGISNTIVPIEAMELMEP